MPFKKLIKRFRFTADTRPLLDLSGGLRLHPKSHAIEVPDIGVQGGASPVDPVYSTATDLTFRTWFARPTSIKQFISISADIVRPKLIAQDAPAVLFDLQYRISNGVDEFYFDGASWIVAALPTEWNTPGDFASNLPSFPVSSLDLDVGFAIVVNMWSNDSRVTPKLRSLKVLFEADISEEYDLLYNSIVPELEAFVIRGRVSYPMPADSNSLDLSDPEDLGFDTAYKITNVVAAYNETIDPRRLDNLLNSFDPNTKVLTLTDVVLTGQRLWVEFEWTPTIAVQTSSDYYEIATLPRIDVTEFRQSDHKVDSTYIEDSVVNPSTGAGWKIVGPRVSNIVITLSMIADKQHDVMQMESAFMKWVASNPAIRMRGLDEEFLMEVTSGPTYATAGSQANISTANVTLMISDVTFYSTPAIEVYAINSLNFTGGNVTLAIPN